MKTLNATNFNIMCENMTIFSKNKKRASMTIQRSQTKNIK